MKPDKGQRGFQGRSREEAKTLLVKCGISMKICIKARELAAAMCRKTASGRTTAMQRSWGRNLLVQ